MSSNFSETDYVWCCRWNIEVYTLIFETYVTLHGKREFVDVIKVKDPEKWRVAYIIQMDPIQSRMSSWKRRTFLGCSPGRWQCEENSTCHCWLWRWRKRVKTFNLKAMEYQRPPKEDKEMDSPLEAPEKNTNGLTDMLMLAQWDL